MTAAEGAYVRLTTHLSGDDNHKGPAPVSLDVRAGLPEELHKFPIILLRKCTSIVQN
jgi:hypothetical protein